MGLFFIYKIKYNIKEYNDYFQNKEEIFRKLNIFFFIDC